MFYQEQYWQEKIIVNDDSRAREHFDNLKDIIPPNACVVDFGCGDGQFAIVAAKMRPDARILAIDKSDMAARDVRASGAKFAENWSADFTAIDLLYASHSVEHVPDINEFFHEASSRVSVDGYFFLEVPNVANISICMGNGHVPHTYMFSEDSFRMMARRFGFDFIGASIAGKPWPGSDVLWHLRVLLRRNGAPMSANRQF